MSYQPKLSESEQERIFKLLLKRPENLTCAECGASSPSWVSLDFGVFVCMNCSGPQISKVRSTRLDVWTQENIDIMDNIGNKIANELKIYKIAIVCVRYWESRLSGKQKPNSSYSLEQLQGFVHDKYVKKLWTKQGLADPKTRYTQCLISGVPFKYSDTSIKKNNFIREANQAVNLNPASKALSKPPLPNKVNNRTFFSDNGSSKQWTEQTMKQFNTTSGVPQKPITNLLDLEQQSPKPQNNKESTEHDLFKAFRSTPGNVGTGWGLAWQQNEQQQQPKATWDQGLQQQSQTQQQWPAFSQAPIQQQWNTQNQQYQQQIPIQQPQSVDWQSHYQNNNNSTTNHNTWQPQQQVTNNQATNAQPQQSYQNTVQWNSQNQSNQINGNQNQQWNSNTGIQQWNTYTPGIQQPQQSAQTQQHYQNGKQQLINNPFAKDIMNLYNQQPQKNKYEDLRNNPFI